jgi:hypothetical protein
MITTLIVIAFALGIVWLLVVSTSFRKAFAIGSVWLALPYRSLLGLRGITASRSAIAGSWLRVSSMLVIRRSCTTRGLGDREPAWILVYGV